MSQSSGQPTANPAPLPRPAVGVGVIVQRGEDVLLVLRRHVHGAGSWSTPGGHLEGGETPEGCAVREVLEETGVAISNVRFCGVTNDIFAAEGRHYITLWLQAEYAAGTPSALATHELSAVEWWPVRALPEELFLSLRHLLAGEGYGLDVRWTSKSADATVAERR